MPTPFFRPTILKRPRTLAAAAMYRLSLRLSILVCIVAGLTYWHLQRTLADQTRTSLINYVTQRGQREVQKFDLATQNHQAMSDHIRRALYKPLEELNDAEVKKRFAQFFVGDKRGVYTDLDADTLDTWQDPSFFHGSHVPLDVYEMRRVLVLRELIGFYGRAYRRQFVSTYITTTANSDLTFWPGLSWGSVKAKEDGDGREEEYYWTGDEKHNPQRTTQWTGIYHDDIAQAWMVSAVTPIYSEDKLMAMLGHDILLDDMLLRASKDRLEGTENAVFQRDGQLIFYPAYTEKLIAADGKLKLQDADESMRKLYDAIDQYLQENPDNILGCVDTEEFYYAFYHFSSPEWIFTVIYPKSLIVSNALSASKFVFVLSGISLLIELLLLASALRLHVVSPLRNFVAQAENLVQQQGTVKDKNKNIDKDDDEIGQLTKTFQSMMQVLSQRDATLAAQNSRLEAMVQMRTGTLEQRTQEMQSVLDHVSEGLALIDRRGHVAAERSAQLLRWFGDIHPGTLLATHLHTFAPDFASWLEAGLAHIAEEQAPPNVILRQLPKQFTAHCIDGITRTFTVSYSFISREKYNTAKYSLQQVQNTTRDQKNQPVLHEKTDRDGDRILVTIVAHEHHGAASNPLTNPSSNPPSSPPILPEAA